MKNILVPTDLSVQSLNVVHEIVKKEEGTVRIVLLHMVQIPSDLSDLLFLRKSHLYAQVPSGFTEAVQLLKNKYTKQVAEMTLHLYYGCRTSVVNSILENNNIDMVYLLGNYPYKLPWESSVNMVPLVEKCKVPVEKVYLHGKIFSQAESGSFSDLLLNQQDGVKYSKKTSEAVYN